MGCASFAITTMHPVAWPAAILWQGLVYISWLPFGWVAWRLAVRYGLTARLIFVLYPVIAAYAAVHAGFATWIDGCFLGHVPHLAAFLYRLPIDLLIGTAIAAFAAAVRGHRLARDADLRTRQLTEMLTEAQGHSVAEARLLVTAGRRRISVAAGSVESLTAAGNYVAVTWREGDGAMREGLMRDTLTTVLDRLDAAVFVRIHRATIVNLARVTATLPMADGGWVLTLDSGAEWVLSRTYRDAVLARLGRA